MEIQHYFIKSKFEVEDGVDSENIFMSIIVSENHLLKSVSSICCCDYRYVKRIKYQ